ncbi:MAG TPA: FHA domain-containing protein [Polyangiaceae bacterium]
MSSDNEPLGSGRPPLGPGAPRASRRQWLEADGRTFELRVGETVIGRGANCQLVLDDALVSRRHAQIVVGADGAVLHDFGSANGVYLNGHRLKEPEALVDSDRIQFGKLQFVFRAQARSLGPERAAFSAETLHGSSPLGQRLGSALKVDTEPGAQPEAEFTKREDAIVLLGRVADKSLALGRGDEAERVLSNILGQILAGATAGREVSAPAIERATVYAAKLAEATARGKWVDYVVALYAALGRPLPVEIIDQLYTVVRKVDAINLSAFRVYLEELRAKAPTLGPSEKFAIQRLEGLERQAALK